MVRQVFNRNKLFYLEEHSKYDSLHAYSHLKWKERDDENNEIRSIVRAYARDPLRVPIRYYFKVPRSLALEFVLERIYCFVICSIENSKTK